ncbi:flagellar basal body-associated FliL family protein [Sphingobium sufflavum]|jgi:flagellar protein FliL|uniref:flagellar basal body-associated FliL family protein n=1 Tax=Sphingobium sufflavum TaxID=1129547 RepID=UPI001F3317E9|nr:flagellar basal body-associated FliL family protein [Sphingobium sufflavum]MCE7795629.1 flagellar basal body-associated FliL family protein [Sphingobium sufflavum]
MSKDAAAPPAKKKGGAKKLIIIGAAVALLGGGGAAAGFYAAGSMHKEAGPVEDPNMPRLVKKGEKPEDVAAKYAPAAGEHGEAAETDAEAVEPEHPHKPVDLPSPRNPSAYQATYYQIPAPFTSNMSDSDAFAQISIAASTYYDQRVITAIQTHELAIRSAILMMLAQEQELDLATPQGKERLQGKLVKIINNVLKDRTGYGGVDNVYFTNFVIQ